jgi:plasmid stability protein
MAILQVRDIDDQLYDHLKRLAHRDKRSISQEVIFIIESFLANPAKITANATKQFLELSGSWQDDRSAEAIMNDLKHHRQSNTRFGHSDVLFD